ncbi:PREDICTED: uncharacterized protein LOC109218682 [Nicotiana attenuata]|uniref:uncharacterized protein LOC109218682 n=1 Tax=Nicotiana attenuata TaxID=49451 RepID=UPI000904DD4B|nr:PREDICTED: uncharacterized protein LOC109218682 [Nicotiana attenuata]
MDIDDNKAPECDGYDALFYKKKWHILGDEVTEAVIDFFHSATMCKAINCTTITLIPKVNNPANIKEFRPISYCIVLYKLISKVMKLLGFPELFLKWIMACVCTVSYSVLINGKPIEPFEAKRGPRNGDPLSPFLFVMAMEYLSRGDLQSVTILYNQFRTFSAASDLVANLNKSNIYFGGVSSLIQQQIMELLGYTKGDLPFRYLGVPLSIKRLTTIQCEPLIDKMLGRIQNRTTKFLYYVGRAMLVKSVIFAIQTFCSEIKDQVVGDTEPKSAFRIMQKIFKDKHYFEAAGYTEDDVNQIESFSIRQIYKAMQGDMEETSMQQSGNA